MKFVSYIYQEKVDYGVLNADGYIASMSDVFAELSIESKSVESDLDSNSTLEIPKDLLEFIDKFGTSLNSEIASVLSGLEKSLISLNDVELLAPIKYPRRNIFCVGKNYKDHALEVTQFTNEASVELPKFPIYFSKATNNLLADQEPVVVRKDLAQKLDYEVELAVIIGKQGSDIQVEDVEDYIFGYAIGNDVSARDLQNERKQWFRGKSLDNSVPLGPWIVSRDEIPYPPQLDITAKVNGELRQSSNTKEFIFDITTLITDLSRGMTLFPGDIILTGTPAGVGVAMDPPRFLQSGDIIEFEIENIGTLTNPVVFKD